MERPAGIRQDTTCATAHTAMLSSVQRFIPMGGLIVVQEGTRSRRKSECYVRVGRIVSRINRHTDKLERCRSTT